MLTFLEEMNSERFCRIHIFYIEIFFQKITEIERLILHVCSVFFIATMHNFTKMSRLLAMLLPIT